MVLDTLRRLPPAPPFSVLPMLTVLAGLMGTGTALAAKVDSVVLANGNVVTGEIKELNEGKLRYSTDSMGTVRIEWDEIDQVVGKAYYRVETTDGKFYFGAIGAGDRPGTLTVTDGGQPLTMEMMDVVLIRPIESGWRDRLDSTFKAGYSYTKSSDIEEFTLAYDGLYIQERYRVNFGANARSTDDGEETTSRGAAYVDYRRWRENQNYWLALGAAETNDELGLDLRTIAGGGYGHRFWRTNTSKAYGEGGAVVNYTENSDGSSDTELEGLLRAGWEIYIHRSPKRSLETTLALFPGITELGEYRSDFDVTLRQELFEDFFWDMSFYHQYDSDVADEDASNSDYGVNTSIGYEF